MCPSSLAAAVTAVAAAIAEGRGGDELSLLAAVFTQLGDTLATMAMQKSICEEKRDTPA